MLPSLSVTAHVAEQFIDRVAFRDTILEMVENINLFQFCRVLIEPQPIYMGNLNVIFSFCREINGEKKNFCLVTNPRKKLKYRMFTEAES